MGSSFKKLNASTPIYGLPRWLFGLPPTMLLLAIAPDWPHGFYQILRLAVCSTSTLVAFFEYKAGHKNLASLFGIIALIFNPAFTVHLDKELWAVIDVGSAFLWICYCYKRLGIRGDARGA